MANEERIEKDNVDHTEKLRKVRTKRKGDRKKKRQENDEELFSVDSFFV